MRLRLLALGARRRSMLVLALGVAGLLAVFSTRAFLNLTQAAPIQIAAVCPQSGDQKHFGAEVVNSVRLYVDQVNRAGGVDGRRIEVRTAR